MAMVYVIACKVSQSCLDVCMYLKEAVGPGDAVKSKDSHVKESQTQSSISHRVLHVSHPALVILMLKLIVFGHGHGHGQKSTQTMKHMFILDHLPC